MLESILEVAERAARSGGAVLGRYFGREDLQVEEKAHNDFVSRADHDSESAIVSEILMAFPEHHILAEERGALPGTHEAEYEWIVDPLDGTSNFLRGLPYFCVSIACLRDGKEVAAVIYDPNRDEIFTAIAGGGAQRNGSTITVDASVSLEQAFLSTGFPFKSRDAIDVYLQIFRDLFLQSRAIRRCGAAALDLAYTAAGIYDGFFEFRLAPWDLAAGALLVREAGGLTTDLDGGGDYLASGNMIAAAPDLHAGMLEVVSRYTSEAGLESLVPIDSGED